jgi:small multidrug resistance pump
MHWLFLALAIVAEVVATSSLKLTEGFSRLWPSLAVIGGYALAFYLLSLTLRNLSVGVAYAIWAGTGIALIALIGWLIFGERLDAPGLIGIGLIVAGVVILNGFSQTFTGH